MLTIDLEGGAIEIEAEGDRVSVFVEEGADSAVQYLTPAQAWDLALELVRAAMAADPRSTWTTGRLGEGGSDD